jgi:type IV pilus assembly protein PilY1
VDRTSLVQQTISAAITGSTVLTSTDLSTSTVALNYYAVSKNPIAWTLTNATPRGWYIDLPNTGQRVIYPLETLVGKYAAVDTVSPSNVSTNPCLTTGSGKAWNYIIDMVTGGGTTESIFANNGGIALTTLVSGYENSADGRTRYIKNDALSSSTSVGFTPLSTQQLPSFGISCTMTNSCATRVSVKRTWRQLYMR